LEQVNSADGTPIAFERFGDGRPLIIVGGATCDRAKTRAVAEHLGTHFAVINYDRRGRGDSGDTAPYSIQREIQDLDALIEEAGGTALVYGHSSGAALVLHAVAAGLPITKFVMHEAPFVPAGKMEEGSRAYAESLAAVLSEDRRGDAIELFFTMVGLPRQTVEAMRQDPSWAALEAIAPTLAYDSAVMADEARGGTVCSDVLAAVPASASALVLTGGASPAWMVETGADVAGALPNARQIVLEGEGHVVAPEALTPVLAEFYASSD
jgi:pimeloyl-ACP methyl ester carboxylesterase